MVCSCKQRRMEATFKGGQDSYRVAEPMMMMMMMMIQHTCGVIYSGQRVTS
jgi:hypothetical protein